MNLKRFVRDRDCDREAFASFRPRWLQVLQLKCTTKGTGRAAIGERTKTRENAPSILETFFSSSLCVRATIDSAWKDTRRVNIILALRS